MRAAAHERFSDRQADATAAAGDQNTLQTCCRKRHVGRSIQQPALSNSEFTLASIIARRLLRTAALREVVEGRRQHSAAVAYAVMVL
ncbi:hypothetical protein O1K_06662 [Xanthomonas fragariae LMG 25863]|nr:hypothetical protein O1K_06662 [Xanthomonas fragariae LMG 25863]